MYLKPTNLMSFDLFLYALFISVAKPLDPIAIKGTKLYNTVTGNRFFIKGVAYQPRNGGLYDPLSVPQDCMRDAKILQQIGVNAIRVYETYATNNHDECADIFNKKGIYLIIDLPNSQNSINRINPVYDVDLLNHFKTAIDAFSTYNNTLAFIAGNEVSNDKQTTSASAFVKATVRDIKAYIKNTSKRQIPVGYANNDDPDTRINIMNYFNCGNQTERVDFFGINIYEWCGKATFENSGFKERTEEFIDYNIPTILSEFGCNAVMPRPFNEIEAIYGPQMNNIFSGGIAYEYSNEDNGYGLVSVKKNDKNVEILQDGVNLQSELEKVKDVFAENVLSSTLEKLPSRRSCPKVNDEWEASSVLPPTPSEDACNCVYQNLKCKITENKLNNAQNSKIGEFLNYACSNFPDKCNPISTNAKEAIYGEYSFCNAKVKSSIVLDSLYRYNNGKCYIEGIKVSDNNETKSNQACEILLPNLNNSNFKRENQIQPEKVNHKQDSEEYHNDQNNEGNNSSNIKLSSSSGVDYFSPYFIKTLFVIQTIAMTTFILTAIP